MQIAEILNRKGSFVATVAPGDPVSQVIRELTRLGIGTVVVSTDGTTIEGIASERDVIRALDEFGTAILDRPVRELMSTTIETCSAEDTVDSLVMTMTNHRIRHVPVVDGGIMVGIVSIGDVVKTRMDELERDRAALVDYIEAR
jgi:CBS domain-containing protein